MSNRECSHTVSEHCITLLIDLSCFYETIRHFRLIEAIATEFEPDHSKPEFWPIKDGIKATFFE